MTDELFTIPPTPATPLQKARARLAKAEKEVELTEPVHFAQSVTDWERYMAARREMDSARNSVSVEENREPERLRAAREGA